MSWSADGKCAEADTNRNHRGFTYVHDEAPEVPWSMHVFKVERGHNGFELCTTLGRGDVFGMATVSEQLKTLAPELGRPMAAVNGDFYESGQRYKGRPRDLQIRQGELISTSSGHTCFWLDTSGKPWITNVQSRLRVVWPDGSETPLGLNEGCQADKAVLYTSPVGESTRAAGTLELVLEPATNSVWLPLRVGQSYTARVREVRQEGNSPLGRDVMIVALGQKLAPAPPTVAIGTEVRIVVETSPDLTGVRTAIGGGPTLVRAGKALQWSGLQFRHPRTAVGWNEDYIFLAQVDGRQSRISIGMTLPELAAYMVKIGCEEAMNLDGGGSSTFWALGHVMNSPSEGRERPAANALVVVQKSDQAQ